MPWQESHTHKKKRRLRRLILRRGVAKNGVPTLGSDFCRIVGLIGKRGSNNEAVFLYRVSLVLGRAAGARDLRR
jgi:hypothetical protein